MSKKIKSVGHLLAFLIAAAAGAQPELPPASLSEQMFVSNTTGGLNTSALRYSGITGIVSAGTGEALVSMYVFRAITPRYFYCEMTNAPNNGAGTQTWTNVLRAAGADTDWSCVISEAETSCSDSSGSPLSAGVAVAMSVTPANTPTGPGVMRCALAYTLSG